MQIPETCSVLFVEGNNDTTTLVNDLLKKAKYTDFNITHVKTLKDGISILNKKEFDVVLLDLVLPNSDGIRTFTELNNSCPEVPVVIISEHDDLGCESVRKGAQDFLPKRGLTSGLVVRSVKYAIERKSLESALKSSKRMYQEIVESTHAAIYEICFRRDRLTYVNNVLCELTGWSEEELLNMSVSDEVLTENSRKIWTQRYSMLLKGERVSNPFEYEINIKNGNIVWCLITASYKKDENNIPVGARVIALDITDRKMAQLEVEHKEQQVYNELEQRLVSWRKESFINRQIQNQQLDAMSNRILSINNGVV